MTLVNQLDKTFSTTDGCTINYLPYEDILWLFKKGANEGDDDEYHYFLHPNNIGITIKVTLAFINLNSV